jgi:threonine dehydrogenase-like Zn-dependent dehydrogenase
VGCKTIIAVDRVKSRIDLAKKLGATHSIDTSEEGFTTLDEAVRKLISTGVSIAIDATGVPAIIEQSVQATRARGKMVIVGAPPTNWDLKVRGGQHLNVSLNLGVEMLDGGNANLHHVFRVGALLWGVLRAIVIPKL